MKFVKDVSSFEEIVNEVVVGDVKEYLSRIPDDSVDIVITSPPYWGLRDYKIPDSIWGGKKNCEHEFGEKIPPRRKSGKTGKNAKISKKTLGAQGGVADNRGSSFCQKCGAWKGQLGLEPDFRDFIVHLCDIFDEVQRVLKPTGTCWVNLGDTYNGMKIGNTNSNKYPGAVTDSFKKKRQKLPEKCLLQVPSRFAIEMTDRGWILRNEIIWYKPNARPESVKDRFTVDFEKLFFFTKKKKYFFDRILEESIWAEKDYRSEIKGGVKAKSGKSTSGEYAISGTSYTEGGMKNKRTVWKICTRPSGSSHYASYPKELVEYPLQSGCPKEVCSKCKAPRVAKYRPSDEYAKRLGKSVHDHEDDLHHGMSRKRREVYESTTAEYVFDRYESCKCGEPFQKPIVLDIFGGTATTQRVAKDYGYNYLYCDIKEEYAKIAEERLSQISLFEMTE